MSRIVTTGTWAKKPSVVPLRPLVPQVVQEAPKLGVSLETPISNSGQQLVKGVLSNGWTRVGSITWDATKWETPRSNGVGIYLKAECYPTQSGLFVHVRLVQVGDLEEVAGSLLSFPEGNALHHMESPALSLVSGRAYMMQADCVGSDDDAAFAEVFASVVVRQSF